jgi:hypothetical protein
LRLGAGPLTLLSFADGERSIASPKHWHRRGGAWCKSERMAPTKCSSSRRRIRAADSASRCLGQWALVQRSLAQTRALQRAFSSNTKLHTGSLRGVVQLLHATHGSSWRCPCLVALDSAKSAVARKVPPDLLETGGTTPTRLSAPVARRPRLLLALTESAHGTTITFFAGALPFAARAWSE